MFKWMALVMYSGTCCGGGAAITGVEVYCTERMTGSPGSPACCRWGATAEDGCCCR